MVLVIFSGTAFRSTALAQNRIGFLLEQLKADDYRQRMRAVLALGSSNDDAALEPLCGVLTNDSNEVVRGGAAGALKKLGRLSSLDCLKRRQGNESTDSVKLQIERAITEIESSGTKYYISLGAVTNNTSRSRAEVERVIQEAILGKLASLGGYKIAPPNEQPAAARTAMSNNLKGWYLSVVVEKFEYTGAGLRVRLQMAVSTYPGKDIKGQLSNAGSIPGASQGDSGREDALMKALAEALTQQFTQATQFR